jgi:LemA protein
MKNKIIIGLVIVLVILGLWCMSSYNSMVKANIAVDTQWAQVETQYQRRFDLIPNLVATVEGVMKQETKIFTDIANARQGYAGAKTVNEKAVAASNLEGALGRLLVITENYPNLKADANFRDLQAQLEGTENRITVARQRYIEAIKEFNDLVTVPPTSWTNSLFYKHEKMPQWDMSADEKAKAEKAPEIKM